MGGFISEVVDALTAEIVGEVWLTLGTCWIAVGAG